MDCTPRDLLCLIKSSFSAPSFPEWHRHDVGLPMSYIVGIAQIFGKSER
jgi:hypothetical protein